MESEDAFAYMVELYIRALPDLNVSLDGFRFLKVVNETDSEIEIVGLSYLLPPKEAPMELTLNKQTDVTSYFLRFGAFHRSLQTDAKRWNAVYLYASGNVEAEWTWLEPVTGKLHNNSLQKQVLT